MVGSHHVLGAIPASLENRSSTGNRTRAATCKVHLNLVTGAEEIVLGLRWWCLPYMQLTPFQFLSPAWTDS